MADEAASEKEARINELRSELSSLEGESAQAAEQVVDDAVDEAIDAVESIEEEARNGAEDVAEAAAEVEDVVESIAEDAARESSLSKEELYDYIMERLSSEGHLPHTHESAAEVEADVLETAPVQPESVEAAPAAVSDTPPQSGHWFYRRRFGR